MGVRGIGIAFLIAFRILYGSEKLPSHEQGMRVRLEKPLLTGLPHPHCSPSYKNDPRYFSNKLLSGYLEDLEDAEYAASERLQKQSDLNQKQYQKLLDEIENTVQWTQILSQALYWHHRGPQGLTPQGKSFRHKLFWALAAKLVELAPKKLLPNLPILKTRTGYQWEIERWIEQPKKIEKVFQALHPIQGYLRPTHIFPDSKKKGLADWNHWAQQKPKIQWRRYSYAQLVVLKEHLLNKFEEESELQTQKDQSRLKFKFTLPNSLTEKERILLRRWERRLACKVPNTMEILRRLPLFSFRFPQDYASRLALQKTEKENIVLSKDLRQIQDYLVEYHQSQERPPHGMPLALRYFLQRGVNHRKILYNAYDPKTGEQIMIYTPLITRIANEIKNRKSGGYYHDNPETIPSILYRTYTDSPLLAWEQILRKIDDEPGAKRREKLVKDLTDKRKEAVEKLRYLFLKNGRILTNQEIKDLHRYPERTFAPLNRIIHTLSKSDNELNWWKSAIKDGLSALLKRSFHNRNNLLNAFVFPKITYDITHHASLPIVVEQTQNSNRLYEIDPKKLRYFETSLYFSTAIQTDLLNYARQQLSENKFKTKGALIDYFNREFQLQTGEDLQLFLCEKAPCTKAELNTHPSPKDVATIDRMLRIRLSLMIPGLPIGRQRENASESGIEALERLLLLKETESDLRVSISAEQISKNLLLKKVARRSLWTQTLQKATLNSLKFGKLESEKYHSERAFHSSEIERLKKEIKSYTKIPDAPKHQKIVATLLRIQSLHQNLITALDTNQFADRVRTVPLSKLRDPNSTREKPILNDIYLYVPYSRISKKLHPIIFKDFPDDKLQNEELYIDEMEDRFIDFMIDHLHKNNPLGRSGDKTMDRLSEDMNYIRSRMRNNTLTADEYLSFGISRRLNLRRTSTLYNAVRFKDARCTMDSHMLHDLRRELGLWLWINRNLKLEEFRRSIYSNENLRAVIKRCFTPHRNSRAILEKKNIDPKIALAARKLQSFEDTEKRRDFIRKHSQGTPAQRETFQGLISFFANAPRGKNSRIHLMLKELLRETAPPHIKGGPGSGRKKVSSDASFDYWEQASEAFKIREWALHESGNARNFKNNAELEKYLREYDFQQVESLNVGKARSPTDDYDLFPNDSRIRVPLYAHKYFEEQTIDKVLKPAIFGPPETALRLFNSPPLPFNRIRDAYPSSVPSYRTMVPRILGQARNYFLSNLLRVQLLLRGKNLTQHFGPQKRGLPDKRLMKLVQAKTEKERSEKLFLLAQGLFSIVMAIDEELEKVSSEFLDKAFPFDGRKALIARELQHLEATLKAVSPSQFTNYIAHTDTPNWYQRLSINESGKKVDKSMLQPNSLPAHIQLSGLASCDWFLKSQHSGDTPYYGLPLQSRIGIQELPFILRTYLMRLCESPPPGTADKRKLIEVLYSPWPAKILNLITSDKFREPGGFKQALRAHIDYWVLYRMHDIEQKLIAKDPKLKESLRRRKDALIHLEKVEIGGKPEEETEEYRRLLSLIGESPLPPPFSKNGIQGVNQRFFGLIDNLHRLSVKEKEMFRKWIVDTLISSYPQSKNLGDTSLAQLEKEITDESNRLKNRYRFHSKAGQTEIPYQFKGAGRFSREVLVLLLGLIDEGGDGESGIHAQYLELAKQGHKRFHPKFIATLEAKMQLENSKQKAVPFANIGKINAYRIFQNAKDAAALYYQKHKKDARAPRDLERLRMFADARYPRWEGLPVLPIRTLNRTLHSNDKDRLEKIRKDAIEWIFKIESERHSSRSEEIDAMLALLKEGRKIASEENLAKPTFSKEEYQWIALKDFRLKGGPTASILLAQSASTAAQAFLIYLIEALNVRLKSPKGDKKALENFKVAQEMADLFYRRFKEDKEKNRGIKRLGQWLGRSPWTGPHPIYSHNFSEMIKNENLSNLLSLKKSAMYWLLQIEKERIDKIADPKKLAQKREALMEQLAQAGEKIANKNLREKNLMAKEKTSLEYRLLALRHRKIQGSVHNSLLNADSANSASQVLLFSMVEALDERLNQLKAKNTKPPAPDTKQSLIEKILAHLHQSKKGQKGLSTVQRYRLHNRPKEELKNLLALRLAATSTLEKRGVAGVLELWERLAQGGPTDEVLQARSILTPDAFQFQILSDLDLISGRNALKEEIAKTGHLSAESKEKLLLLAQRQIYTKWLPRRSQMILSHSSPDKSISEILELLKKDLRKELSKVAKQLETELRDEVYRTQLKEYRKVLIGKYTKIWSSRLQKAPQDPLVQQRAQLSVESELKHLPSHIGYRPMSYLRQEFFKYRRMHIHEIAKSMADAENKKGASPKATPNEFYFKATQAADKELASIVEMMQKNRFIAARDQFKNKLIQRATRTLSILTRKKPTDPTIQQLAKEGVEKKLSAMNEKIDFAIKHRQFLEKAQQTLYEDLVAKFVLEIRERIEESEETLLSSQRHFIPKSYPEFLKLEFLPAIRAAFKKLEETDPLATDSEKIQMAWESLRNQDMFNFESVIFPHNFHDRKNEVHQLFKNHIEESIQAANEEIRERVQDEGQLSQTDLCRSHPFRPAVPAQLSDDKKTLQVKATFPFQGQLPLNTRKQRLECLQKRSQALQQHEALCTMSGGKIEKVSHYLKPSCIQRIWDNRIVKGELVKGKGNFQGKVRGTWGFSFSLQCSKPILYNENPFSRYANGSFEQWKQVQNAEWKIQLAPEEKAKWRKFLKAAEQFELDKPHRVTALRKRLGNALYERNTVAQKINQANLFKTSPEYRSKTFSTQNKERFEMTMKELLHDLQIREAKVTKIRRELKQLVHELNSQTEDFINQKNELEAKLYSTVLSQEEAQNETSPPSLKAFSEQYFDENFRKLGIHAGKKAESAKTYKEKLSPLLERYINWREKGEYLVKAIAEEGKPLVEDKRWQAFVKEGTDCKSGFFIEEEETRSFLEPVYHAEVKRLRGMKNVLKELAAWGIRWNGAGLDFTGLVIPQALQKQAQQHEISETALLPLLDKLDTYLPADGKRDPLIEAIGLPRERSAVNLFKQSLLAKWNAEGRPAQFEWYDVIRFGYTNDWAPGVAVTVKKKEGKYTVSFRELNQKRSELRNHIDKMKEKLQENMTKLQALRIDENHALPVFFKEGGYHERVEENLRDIRKLKDTIESYGNISGRLAENAGRLPAALVAQHLGMQYKHEVLMDVEDMIHKIHDDRFWREASWTITAVTLALPFLAPIRGAGLLMAMYHGWRMGVGLHMTNSVMRQDIMPLFADKSEAYWSDLGPETLWSGATFAIGNGLGYGWGVWANSGRMGAGWITRTLSKEGAHKAGGLTRLARILANENTQQMTSIFGTTVGLEHLKEAIAAYRYAYSIDTWETLKGGAIHGAQNAFYMWGPDQRLAGWLGRSRWSRLMISVGALQIISIGLNTYHYYEMLDTLEEQLAIAKKSGDAARIQALEEEIKKTEKWHAYFRFLWQQQVSELPTHFYFGSMAANHGWQRKIQKDLTKTADPKTDHEKIYETAVAQAREAHRGWFGFLKRKPPPEIEKLMESSDDKNNPERAVQSLIVQMPLYELNAIREQAKQNPAGGAQKVIEAAARAIRMTPDQFHQAMDAYQASEDYLPQSGIHTRFTSPKRMPITRLSKIGHEQALSNMVHAKSQAEREGWLAHALNLEIQRNQILEKKPLVGTAFKKHLPLESLLTEILKNNRQTPEGEPANLSEDQVFILQSAGIHYFPKQPHILLNLVATLYRRLPKPLHHWEKQSAHPLGIKEMAEYLANGDAKMINKILVSNRENPWFKLEDIDNILGEEAYHSTAADIATLRNSQINRELFYTEFENADTLAKNEGQSLDFEQFYKNYVAKLP